MSGPTRRQFVKVAAVTSGAVLVGCGSDGDEQVTPAPPGDAGAPDADAGSPPDDGGMPPHDAAKPIVPPEATPESMSFPLGIASGDPGADDIVLWTQYQGAAPLVATVWEMNGEAYVLEVGTFPGMAAEAGFVHVVAGGLTRGKRYRYTFFELDGNERIGRSAIGRFRAPIADDAMESLVFGAVSCTDNSKPFDTLGRAAEQELDAFLFLGDNSYCDGCEVLADYRDLYVEHWAKPEHQALRASTGVLMTWDDHEVENDWNPETIAPQKLADATQAFFEHAPIRRLPETPDRIWRSVRWGKTAEVFVLDCRSERLPSTILSGTQTYISSEQMEWLKAGLKASTSAFKLIMNSVPITAMPLIWDVYPTDRWEGYPDQRAEILEFIEQERIGGVAWLSGDFHLAFIGHVAVDGPGSTQLEILVGPGAQTPSPLAWTLQPPQFDWATDVNNYTALHLDPSKLDLRVVYHDKDGAPIHDATYNLA